MNSMKRTKKKLEPINKENHMSKKTKEPIVLDLSQDPIRVQQYFEYLLLKSQLDETKQRIKDIGNEFHDVMRRSHVNTIRFGHEMGLKRSVSYANRFQKSLLEISHPGLYEQCKVKDENPSEKLMKTSKV
jgi:hypothetical protein